MNLTLNVEFGTGIYHGIVSHPSSQQEEWPPHPYRVFAAILNGSTFDPSNQKHIDALLKFENLQSPIIEAPDTIQTLKETTYVPGLVDTDAKIYGKVGTRLKLTCGKLDYVDFKLEKDNTFIHMYDKNNRTVKYTWSVQNMDPAVIETLEYLVSGISYVGAARSLVSVWFSNEPCVPNYIPRSDGSIKIRKIHTGLLEHLTTCHNRSIYPNWKATENYVNISSIVTSGKNESPWMPMMFKLVNVNGTYVSHNEIFHLIRAVRGAIFSTIGQNIPESISGHTPDGKLSRKNHITIFPLINVNGTYDDKVYGVGIGIPTDMTVADREILIQALHKFESERSINMGFMGSYRLIPTKRSHLQSLSELTYAGSGDCLVSATPVAFDRYFDVYDGNESLKVIAKMCSDINLPMPTSFSISETSYFNNMPNSKQVKCYQKGNRRYFQNHLLLQFSEPVHGLRCIGSGRYSGYGLMIPIQQNNMKGK